jgi:hypothetical protein
MCRLRAKRHSRNSALRRLLVKTFWITQLSLQHITFQKAKTYMDIYMYDSANHIKITKLSCRNDLAVNMLSQLVKMSSVRKRTIFYPAYFRGL